jgi:hypothetical protein
MRRLRRDAKAAGLIRYFTGKVCPRGHIAERFVSNYACVACLDMLNKTEKGKARLRASGRKHDQKRQSTEKYKALRKRCNRKYRGTEKGMATKRRRDRKHHLAHSLRNRLRSAIRSNQRSGSAVRDLGCSIPEFRIYIEVQFQQGWSWENRGTVWHIDHIRPLAQFDLSDREQLLQAVHYTNLRPYPAELNIREGDRKRRSPTCGD